MKHFISAVGLCFAITLFSETNILAKDPPASAEQLRDELVAALKSGNSNAVLSLFFLDGLEGDGADRGRRLSSAETQAAFFRELWPRFPTNTLELTLAPLPKEFRAFHAPKADDGMGDEWVGDNGWRERWSVPPLGMFESQPPAKFRMPLIYGKTNGAFYIGIPIVYTAPGKSLYVHTLASVTYTGSWVFVKNGKEHTVNFSDKTNQFRECWGDYIKSCTVQSTSTNPYVQYSSWLNFTIKEDGTNVFESGEITNNEPFVYERK